MRGKQVTLEDFEFSQDRRVKRLTPLKGASSRTIQALTQNLYIGSGTFSRVYEINPAEVVKFSWNLETLQLLRRLGDKSSFYPKVHEIYVDEQAEDERGRIYYAAVVEKLYQDTPNWVFD